MFVLIVAIWKAVEKLQARRLRKKLLWKAIRGGITYGMASDVGSKMYTRDTPQGEAIAKYYHALRQADLPTLRKAMDRFC